MNRESTPADAAFELDARLAGEALRKHSLPLCEMLCRNEARLPWIVLVPRVSGAAELFDLSAADQQIALTETSTIASALKTATGAQKINIAQFGNMVRQLHIHIVARFESDPWWPGSAIGVGPAAPYSSEVSPDWWEALLAALARNDLKSP